MRNIEEYNEMYAFNNVNSVIRGINGVIGGLLDLDRSDDYESIIVFTRETAQRYVKDHEKLFYDLTDRQLALIEELRTHLNEVKSSITLDFVEKNLFAPDHQWADYRIRLKRKRKKAKTAKAEIEADIKAKLEAEGASIFDIGRYDSTWFTDNKNKLPSDPIKDEESAIAQIGLKSTFYKLRERTNCLYTFISAIQNKNTKNGVFLSSFLDEIEELQKTLAGYILNASRKLFGHRLSAVMENLDVSQSELAYAVGVTRQTVHAWCNGSINANIDNLVSVSAYLNISIDYLIKEAVGSTVADEQMILSRLGFSNSNIVELQHISKTAELLSALKTILDYSSRGENTDLLTALSKYFSTSSTYLLTDKDINELVRSELDTNGAVDFIRQRQKSDYPTLRTIENILLQIKERIVTQTQSTKPISRSLD